MHCLYHPLLNLLLLCNPLAPYLLPQTAFALYNRCLDEEWKEASLLLDSSTGEEAAALVRCTTDQGATCAHHAEQQLPHADDLPPYVTLYLQQVQQALSLGVNEPIQRSTSSAYVLFKETLPYNIAMFFSKQLAYSAAAAPSKSFKLWFSSCRT